MTDDQRRMKDQADAAPARLAARDIPSGLVDIDEVSRRTGLSESTILRMRKRSHFPDGEMRGRTRLWSVAAIELWLELRVAAQVEQARAAAERSLQSDRGSEATSGEAVQPGFAAADASRHAGSSVFLPEHLHRARLQASDGRRRVAR